MLFLVLTFFFAAMASDQPLEIRRNILAFNTKTVLLVKAFPSGAQLQTVQILKESRVNKGIYLYLSFFPSPRHVVLSAQGFSLVEGKEKPADFKPGKSISLPISQFLKAHFNGQRLSQDLQLDENEKAQARLTF